MSARTHGASESAEYKIWTSMLTRCRNSKSKNFADYGSRGIRICERWLRFENFISDMGARPSARHSIERKENNCGYGPDNCYWATPLEQANNKRNNVHVQFEGKTLTLAQWARETGIRYVALTQRHKAGWAPARMLTESVGFSKGRI